MLLVQNSLEEFGLGRYQLEWASQLRHGIDRLGEGLIDVVLLDLGLPESAGPVSYVAVREAAPRVPVVVLTADHREQTVQVVIRAGAEGYLVKDEVSASQLIRAISEAISRRKMQSEQPQLVPFKFRGGVWRWQTTGLESPPLGEPARWQLAQPARGHWSPAKLRLNSNQ